MDFKESAMAEVRNAESSFNVRSRRGSARVSCLIPILTNALLQNFFSAARANLREARSRGENFSDGAHHYGDAERELMSALAAAQEQFRRAMCDSFDTPAGMQALLDVVSKANVYERSRARKEVNVGTVEAVARFVGDMLRMLGLGEGAVREGDIGWGEAAKAGEANGNINELLMPYLRALSTFRDQVRALARSKAPHLDLLKLADGLRDRDMVDLGVALEDQEDGKALVKLVPAEHFKQP
ncbi:hypothetical protein L7F22_034847 [Adiantum nelumboides]|nr:hypothetical protein [Adiantum nelumboides]